MLNRPTFKEAYKKGNHVLDSLTIMYNTIALVHKLNPGSSLPYHNNKHMRAVAYFCHNILMYSKTNRYLNINSVDLFTGALLHDVAHSGGYYKDDKDNIKSTLNYIYKSEEIFKHYFGDKEKLTALIMGTQYPYVHSTLDNIIQENKNKHPDLKLSIDILQDADLCTIFCKDGVYILIEYLYRQEMNYTDLDKIKDNMINFYTNTINFKTEYCIDMWSTHKDIIMQEIYKFNIWKDLQ